jgi:ABC-2 type transport system ATP-binding protein
MLAPGSDSAAAVAAISAHAAGPVAIGAGGLQLTAQMPAQDGITTDLVRALDLAGIAVTSIAVRRPSLDDVFLTLTGHGTGGARGHQPAAAGSDETGQLAGWDEDDGAGLHHAGAPRGGAAA